VETFTAPRPFVEGPGFRTDRRDALAALDLGDIDEPIVDIVAGFTAVPHCFTLQCCYGHFVCTPGQDPRNLDAIPHECAGPVRYRIAYIGFCLENSRRGRALRDSLARIPAIDTNYIQFGSADWFWKEWVNSYALQVEPAAHQLKDEAILEPAEAFHTQEVRELFFGELRALLASELHAA
jgi:hypothetical protein